MAICVYCNGEWLGKDETICFMCLKIYLLLQNTLPKVRGTWAEHQLIDQCNRRFAANKQYADEFKQRDAERIARFEAFKKKIGEKLV